MHMADVPMTLDTSHLLKMLRIVRNGDRLDHLLMTIPAGFFGHLPVTFSNTDRLMKAADREVIGMPKSVRSLGVILAEEIMRRMAVITGCGGMVAGLLPSVELVVHYVTIGARRRVVAHVRIPLPVPKRINPDPNRKAQADSEQDEF